MTAENKGYYVVNIRIYPGSKEYELLMNFKVKHRDHGALATMVRKAIRDHLKKEITNA